MDPAEPDAALGPVFGGLGLGNLLPPPTKPDASLQSGGNFEFGGGLLAWGPCGRMAMTGNPGR